MPERVLDEEVFVPVSLRHSDHIDKMYGVWNGDSYLYEKTFFPVVPYAVKEVVWYQGESDTTVAESKVYTELLSRFISAWREDLQDNEIPFVVI